MQRRRFKHVLSFPDRLANESERLREEAEKLPHGPEREILLRKARQADIALHDGRMAFLAGIAAAQVAI
jgi:hypothetical protein